MSQERIGKRLLGLAFLWFALDVCAMIGGASGIVFLQKIGVMLIFFSYVGIPILMIVGSVMAFIPAKKETIIQSQPSQIVSSSVREIIVTALVFLAGVILPPILNGTYKAAHPGFSIPLYIATMGFWINALVLLLSIIMIRRQSVVAKTAGIIFIILSVLYFAAMLLVYMLAGFQG